jgi:hypothetical protein
MSSLIDVLQGVLGSGELGKISQQLGADEGKTKSAVETAMPMLLGALSRNASTGDGAESLLKALTKDHDGSVLDNPSAVLDNPGAGPGDGILGHVLGARRPAVEAGVGQVSGLDAGSAGKLLTMLAPMVMGALGKTQRQNGLDAGGLAQMLGQEGRELESKQPQAMGRLGAVLDADGDGDFDLGDAAKHGMKALGKFFKK